MQGWAAPPWMPMFTFSVLGILLRQKIPRFPDSSKMCGCPSPGQTVLSQLSPQLICPVTFRYPPPGPPLPHSGRCGNHGRKRPGCARHTHSPVVILRIRPEPPVPWPAPTLLFSDGHSLALSARPQAGCWSTESRCCSLIRERLINGSRYSDESDSVHAQAVLGGGHGAAWGSHAHQYLRSEWAVERSHASKCSEGRVALPRAVGMASR